MEQCNLDVLGLTIESKMERDEVTNGASYVYAGVTEDRANDGVGMVIVEQWADCVTSLKGGQWKVCNSEIKYQWHVVNTGEGIHSSVYGTMTS